MLSLVGYVMYQEITKSLNIRKGHLCLWSSDEILKENIKSIDNNVHVLFKEI